MVEHSVVTHFSIYKLLSIALILISYPGPPTFPVNGKVVQDNDTNMVINATHGTTVIGWDPASVSSGGVRYNVWLHGVEVVSRTSATSAMLTVELNRIHSVSVEAVNCNDDSSHFLLNGSVLVPFIGDR